MKFVDKALRSRALTNRNNSRLKTKKKIKFKQINFEDFEENIPNSKVNHKNLSFVDFKIKSRFQTVITVVFFKSNLPKPFLWFLTFYLVRVQNGSLLIWRFRIGDGGRKDSVPVESSVDGLPTISRFVKGEPRDQGVGLAAALRLRVNLKLVNKSRTKNRWCTFGKTKF